MTSILIVDDALFMRRLIRKILEANDFEIVGEAENGEVAIEKYFECKPDIVIMAFTMPRMTGIEALEEIMLRDALAKIVMICAIGQEVLVKEAIISGAQNVIIKPFNEAQIVQTLRQAILEPRFN